MLRKFLLAASICMALLTARVFAEPAAEVGHPADEAHSAEAQHSAGEHEAPAPLLPATLEEFKEFFLGPAIWILVIFVALLAILYPLAWSNVLAGLKARERRIRGDIAAAEVARQKSQSTLKQFNDQIAAAEARVREMLCKATVDGEKLATTIRTQAQAEAEEIKDRANKEIDASKRAAIGEIHQQAGELSTSIAEKIMRRPLIAAEQQELVRRMLSESN